MRLREFKEPRQRLDEVAPAVPIWFALSILLGGAVGSWNTMSDKQKSNSYNWFKNNVAKNRETVKKVLPYLAPGGLGGSTTLNSPVGVEKLEPIVNNPEEFNIGIKNKKLPQPGPTGGTDSKIKNTQPTPLVQPKQKDSSPGIIDRIQNWFSDTFGSGTKSAPVNKVDKSVLAPPIDTNRKIKPAYKIPNIAAPVDNGDGTVTWNGQVYDKDFDANKLEKDMKRIKTAPTPPVKKDVLPSIGGGQGGAVTGPKDKGKDGGVLGSPGEIGELPWDGGVSGGKVGTDGKAKPQIGDIGNIGDVSQGSTISKGSTGVGQGAQAGTKDGVIPTDITQGSTIARTLDIAKPVDIVRTMPPPPPPIAQAPQGPKYRKYDPKKDKDIIYKGKDAPKNVVDFKAIKTGVGGMADRLRIK